MLGVQPETPDFRQERCRILFHAQINVIDHAVGRRPVAREAAAGAGAIGQNALRRAV